MLRVARSIRLRRGNMAKVSGCYAFLKKAALVPQPDFEFWISNIHAFKELEIDARDQARKSLILELKMEFEPGTIKRDHG